MRFLLSAQDNGIIVSMVYRFSQKNTIFYSKGKKEIASQSTYLRVVYIKPPLDRKKYPRRKIIKHGDTFT